MNDINSSITNTNDSIFTNILLFVKASLDTSANTLLLNAATNYIISPNRFEESLFQFSFFFFFEYFCYILISVTFLPYPNVAFFLTIYSFSFNSQVSFYLFANIIFLHSLFVYTQVSLQYLRHPPDDCNFCFIYLYVQYSYKKFKKILIATYLRFLKRFHFF